MSGSSLALRTSPLSLLYKEWTWERYRKLNLIFFTLLEGASMGVFIVGLSQCFGRKWVSKGPLVRSVGRPSFLAAPTLGIGCPMHRPSLTCWQRRVWKGTNTWPVGPILAQLGPDFVPHHPLMSYYLRLPLVLNIMKICMDFCPYDAFPSSDVREMVDQQNLWNSLVIDTYLLYLAWNVGMLAVNICILWPPTDVMSENFT
jgi:hypothetical protein